MNGVIGVAGAIVNFHPTASNVVMEHKNVSDIASKLDNLNFVKNFSFIFINLSQYKMNNILVFE